MLRPRRGESLTLGLVQRLDRNDCSGTEGRYDGEPV
jgi:hypothetical protein